MNNMVPDAEAFDVFFSYSRKDVAFVTAVAEAMKDAGLRVWFDEWEAIPGRPWQRLIQRGIADAKATAVFIGPEGLGKWEAAELDAAVEEAINRDCPLIPVLLPGVRPNIRLPAFLARNSWVRFLHEPNEPVALRRLRFGITGERPLTEARPEEGSQHQAPQRDAEIPEAVRKLAAKLLEGNITYFLGPGIPRPASSQIARFLIGKLGISGSAEDVTLPIELAGLYYALKESDSDLEALIVELIRDQPHAIPPTYLRLGELLALLSRRPLRRGLAVPCQLIVTTNYDVMIERALLTRGVSFTRIVQHRLLRRLEVNQYKVSAEGEQLFVGETGQRERIRGDDLDDLDYLIRVTGRRGIDLAPEPGPVALEGATSLLSVDESSWSHSPCILYKYYGSQDVPNSCAISIDQHLELIRRAAWRGTIPEAITEIVSNSPLLFMGYSFLDPGFRLIRHTLLRNRLPELYPGFALSMLPLPDDADFERRIETTLWDRIKDALKTKGIRTIECHPAAFLERLAATTAEKLR